MRIFLLTTHLDIGGIPQYTVGLAKQLVRRGHEPWVISSGGVLERDVAAAGIPHLTLDVRTRSEFHPKLGLALPVLAWWLRRVRPDVLHAQTRVTQVLAGLVGRWMGVPVVTTAHGFYRWHWGRKFFPFLGRRVIAISKTVRQQLIEQFHVSAERVALVMNGIPWTPLPPERLRAETFTFRHLWGIANGGPVIGCIARLSAVKGQHILLEAFAQFRQRHPAAQLVLVGDGPERAALIRRAYALDLQEAVVLTGSVDHTEVPLAVIDIFVLPSLQEGFGLALVEAMAASKPVIASAVEGLPEIVRADETGLLVPPSDPRALASALERLASDPHAAREMGQRGRRRFEDHFTIERMAAEIERVYETVTTAPAGKA